MPYFCSVIKKFRHYCYKWNSVKGRLCACVEDLSLFAQVRHVGCFLDGQGLMFSLVSLFKHSLQTFVFFVSFKTVRRKFSQIFILKVHFEFRLSQEGQKKDLLFVPTRIRVNFVLFSNAITSLLSRVNNRHSLVTLLN